MDGVGVGDQVEEVAAGIGGEEDVLQAELPPRFGLADEEDQPEYGGGGEPGKSAAGDRLAETKPLVHDVVFAEHGAAGDLHGYGADEKHGGIEPEDGRNGRWQPLIDVAVVGINVTGALRDKECADDGDEEHGIAGEREEETQAGATESFAWATSSLGSVVPVVVIAPTAGPLIGWRAATMPAVVIVKATFLFPLSVDWRDGGWHGEASPENDLLTAYSGLTSGVV